MARVGFDPEIHFITSLLDYFNFRRVIGFVRKPGIKRKVM
jgi:hypothetical protein